VQLWYVPPTTPTKQPYVPLSQPYVPFPIETPNEVQSLVESLRVPRYSNAHVVVPSECVLHAAPSDGSFVPASLVAETARRPLAAARPRKKG
jgi:hypothetical protein